MNVVDALPRSMNYFEAVTSLSSNILYGAAKRIFVALVPDYRFLTGNDFFLILILLLQATEAINLMVERGIEAPNQRFLSFPCPPTCFAVNTGSPSLKSALCE